MLPYSVLVKVLKPTDTKGARIKAWLDGPNKACLILPWDHSINTQANKDKACLELIKKIGTFKGSLGQYYLTRGELESFDFLTVYTLQKRSERLEIPKH